MDHELELVEGVVLQQVLDERGATGYPDVLSGLPLQSGDLFCDVTFDQRRVVPPEWLFEGRRVTYLGVSLMKLASGSSAEVGQYCAHSW